MMKEVNTKEGLLHSPKPLLLEREKEDKEEERDEKVKKAGGRVTLVSIVAIVMYGSTSVVQTIFNKKILATYEFHASNILLLLQMFLSTVILLTLRHFGVFNFPAPNLNTASKILPLSICYFATVLLALVSLPNLSLAMYSTLKRLVALVILVCEYFVLNKTAPLSIWCSVGVMLLGALIAGASDISFDFIGYTFALSSCFFQALYLVLVKKNAKDIGPVEMLFYNSTLAMPFVCALAVSFDELTYTLNFPLFADTGFKLYFFLSIALGSFLNFFIFYCTSVNSPLTTAVTGQVKNIVTTILGVVIFNDLIIQAINIFGLSVNAMGGAWYAYLKLRSGGGGGG